MKPAHNLFCKRHYPIIVITITRHVLYTGKCTRLGCFRDHKSVIIMNFMNTWTQVSPHCYIKLIFFKRLDNDIETKSISKTCTNYETKGKPRKKKCHIPVSNPNYAKHKNSVCMERNSSTPIPLDHIAVDIRSVITWTVQVNRTSWLRQNSDEKFCKITKICLLETK